MRILKDNNYTVYDKKWQPDEGKLMLMINAYELMLMN